VTAPDNQPGTAEGRGGESEGFWREAEKKETRGGLVSGVCVLGVSVRTTP
jgi:hypothetical protein